MSALPAFEKSEAAKKIIHIRPLYLANANGNTDELKAWEARLIASVGAKSDILNNLQQYIVKIDAAKEVVDSHKQWEINRREESMRFIKAALSPLPDIRKWSWAGQGVDAVITVCRFTPGLVDFGEQAAAQMVAEDFDQRGTWYELGKLTIESDRVSDIEAWQAGLQAMRELIRSAAVAAQKMGIRSPFPEV